MEGDDVAATLTAINAVLKAHWASFMVREMEEEAKQWRSLFDRMREAARRQAIERWAKTGSLAGRGHLVTYGQWSGPSGPCLMPPPGWWCSRQRGHEGPCAARPFGEDVAPGRTHRARVLSTSSRS